MTDTSSNFTATLRELWAMLVKASGYAIAGISSISWTSLAIAAVTLAVIITAVPLAIGLFVVFVVVKFGLNALESRRRRGQLTPYKDVEGS